MKIVVNCTDCGHTRIVDGVDTAGLPVGELRLDTHSCECTTVCATCEDLEILHATEERLESKIKKLELQLAGALKTAKEDVGCHG